MKPNEFLFEAEQNIKKAKAEQYLDQLSDADLVAVASLLKGSLEESVQDLSAQKKAGKRIDGRPSDFIAYDDTTQTAKRYQETPQGLRVLDVNYSPPPRGYVVPTQSVPAPQPEVKSFVASLDNEEKEALLNVVKKEAKKRKSEPKKSEPKKSSSGKVVAGVLAGLLALGIYMTPDSDSTKTSSTSVDKPVAAGVNKNSSTSADKSVATPTAEKPNSTNTQPNQAEKQSTENEKGWSTFSIKGLHFGMSVADVVNITKAKVDDDDAYYKADSAERDRYYDALKTNPMASRKYIDRYSGEFKKLATDEYDSLKGFTIGGYENWYPEYYKGKLSSISNDIKPDDFNEWVEKLSQKYGKPNISSSTVGNKMGYKDINYKAIWNVQGVTIVVAKYGSTFSKGYVWFGSDKFSQSQSADNRAEKNKQSKDF